MCLILIAHRAHPDIPLVVAANRDERYLRPSAPAHFWPDASHVLAGRDLEAGGSWLGISRSGRFAAVTNIRNGAPTPEMARSRGELVRGFLEGRAAPYEYCQRISEKADEYRGFNLLVGNRQSLVYSDNLNGTVRRLEPGTVMGSAIICSTRPGPKW